MTPTEQQETWVAKQGCNHKDHPSWKNKLGITNPFKD